MSELREAAQAVLNDYDGDGTVEDTEQAINRLRAALAQPESEARPPRDEWRLASEVPDSDRVVLLWSTEFDKTGSLEVGWYGKPDGSDEAPCWWASHGLPQDPRDILYWRDVQPPTEGKT